MKIIGLLYFIFVIALSIVPCSDGTEGEHAAASKFEKVNPCADGPAESCAALCLCQCCGQSIILGAFSDFQRLNPSALTVVVVFPLHLHTTTHLHQIWEPPKSA